MKYSNTKIQLLIIVFITLSLTFVSNQNETNSTNTTNTTTLTNGTSNNSTNTTQTNNISQSNNNTNNNNQNNNNNTILKINKTFVPAEFGYLCDSQFATNLEIDKNITICIHFAEKKYRVAFPVKVDQYSVLTVSGGIYIL
jgi:hypothetical protein